MKKIFSIILAITIILSLGTNVFAAETGNTEKMGNYDSLTGLIWEDGTENPWADFSPDLIEWLSWYNSLSEDEQLAVNYWPAELGSRMLTEQTTVISATEANSFENKISSFSAAEKMPTGGYELPYNQTYWDEKVNYANCYAYSMNVISTTEYHKLQPGEVSGNTYKLTSTSIFDCAKADGPKLGNGRTIRKSSYSEVPGVNEYKVALVIAPNVDYHWYRQDSDGGWSHKRGLTKIGYKDASDKYIYDPQTCDRNYSGANYSTWCGYYIVTY